MRRWLCCLFVLGLLSTTGCFRTREAAPSAPYLSPPSGRMRILGQPSLPMKSAKLMRGTWISTVYNIDWPQDPRKVGFHAENQKQQFVDMLNKLQAIGINAVFVQVWPTSDAFYPSKFLPWSEWLTGIQGKDPGYNPLKFMIEEAHKRGMQFHAWLNPYRVSVQGDLSKLVDDHPAKKHPEWVVKHQDKLLYNPGMPGVTKLIVDSIMEIVHNYHVDGIHMDDYFYPYNEDKERFNDEDTYAKYNKGFRHKADWRRNNVNQLVQAAHAQIKAVKPHVKFGISPYGVWRSSNVDPTGSATKLPGSYDTLYADSRAWIRNKSVDYVIPQIYWPIGDETASYDTLVKWWVKETAGTGVELYIGHGVYKLGEDKEAWDSPDELIRQMEFNKKFDSIAGSVFFGATDLIKNTKQVSDVLQQHDAKNKK